MSSNRNALPDGTILNSRYKIERFIGGGGFGLVYQAKHLQLNMAVAIKELLPSNIATREGSGVHPISSDHEGIYQKTLSCFRKEGKCLVQLINCEHIVRCTDYFEENNTGYLVMDYVEGTPLTSFIESYKEEGQPFSQVEIVDWLKDLLAGLKQVHKKGILHLDIKPGNIFIRREDERPILLDFGASKSTTGHSTGSGLLIGTPPYAPFEQMQRNGNMGPWSDIYALGILMYQLVFGDDIEELPSSNERVGEDRLESARSRGKSGYGDGFLALIDKCVSREIKERPQSIEEMEALLSSAEGKMKPERKQERIQEEKDSKLSHKKWTIFKIGKLSININIHWGVGVATALVLIGGGGVYEYKPDLVDKVVDFFSPKTYVTAYTTSPVNVYADAADSAQVIGRLPKNKPVQVVVNKQDNDGWSRVKFKEIVGYVPNAKIINPEDIEIRPRISEFIAKSDIPIYHLPNLEFGSGKNVVEGDPIKILGDVYGQPWATGDGLAPVPTAAEYKGTRVFLPEAKVSVTWGWRNSSEPSAPRSSPQNAVYTLGQQQVWIGPTRDFVLGSAPVFKARLPAEYDPIDEREVVIDGTKIGIVLQPCYSVEEFETRSQRRNLRAEEKNSNYFEQQLNPFLRNNQSKIQAKEKAEDELRDKCQAIDDNAILSNVRASDNDCTCEAVNPFCYNDVLRWDNYGNVYCARLDNQGRVRFDYQGMVFPVPANYTYDCTCSVTGTCTYTETYSVSCEEASCEEVCPDNGAEAVRPEYNQF